MFQEEAKGHAVLCKAAKKKKEREVIEKTYSFNILPSLTMYSLSLMAILLE